MVSGVSEGIDLEIVIFVFYGDLGFLEYPIQFEDESRAARMKSHPAKKGSWGGNWSARRALLKSATAGDTTGRERCG